MIKFLIDENVDPHLSEWLRTIGHDVVHVGGTIAGIEDREVLELAESEERAIITHDLDFAHILYNRNSLLVGILIIRLAGLSRADVQKKVKSTWALIIKLLPNTLVVLSKEKIRTRPLVR